MTVDRQYVRLECWRHPKRERAAMIAGLPEIPGDGKACSEPPGFAAGQVRGRAMGGVNDARFGGDGSSLPFWLTEVPSVPDDSLSRALTIPLEPQSVPLARRWVRHTLGRWGLGDLADAAAQIASELTTNAIIHADPDSSVVLLLMFAAGTLRLEVRDRDRQNLPLPRNPTPTEIDGRGLIIVEAIADRWGVRVTNSGKSVWAELDTGQARKSVDDGCPGRRMRGDRS